ncbi:hypothetical protein FCL47_23315 [Desulfopila sp. IMCC35006]|uniref:hypothetical protein n=1 Tax=Desulfopila sp. IMCC35006 TaxID=2569542 RepID=UPI0010ACB92E|nr:hypothetical protein [Desulfopila sp. IMCC35006]TKB23290.1 hypothetical protein FCL47_23315 [Desulfopila sp. IMCC35006]
MGFSITWCAVHEKDADRLLEDLSLLPTGETEEFPESHVSMAKLDSGWRIIWCNKYNSPIIESKRLAEISRERDVLFCLVEEHVMASSSEFWSGGNRRWWISHQGENGPKGLDVTGEVPECFPAIKREMEEAQQAEDGGSAEVDYIFEIPLKVAQELVGFKHDEDCSQILKEQFIVLASPSPKKGFFSRLFGK